MPKILIIYFSQSGNTQKMAKLIEEGVTGEGVEVELKEVKKAKIEDLLKADGIIVGSPTYYGTMAAEIKDFFDKSVKLHGKLEGKVGAAFSSSHNVGGGNETTIMDILKVFLIHGMIIEGNPKGDHYGTVAIAAPDERSCNQCKQQGQRAAKLVKKLNL
ncbi:NAD(P)H-dependent oxidoreductase [bacterium]|nr:NAD(P)H-dependent oxidoreductase [bacterium]